MARMFPSLLRSSSISTTGRERRLVGSRLWCIAKVGAPPYVHSFGIFLKGGQGRVVDQGKTPLAKPADREAHSRQVDREGFDLLEAECSVDERYSAHGDPQTR